MPSRDHRSSARSGSRAAKARPNRSTRKADEVSDPTTARPGRRKRPPEQWVKGGSGYGETAYGWSATQKPAAKRPDKTSTGSPSRPATRGTTGKGTSRARQGIQPNPGVVEEAATAGRRPARSRKETGEVPGEPEAHLVRGFDDWHEAAMRKRSPRTTSRRRTTRRRRADKD